MGKDQPIMVKRLRFFLLATTLILAFSVFQDQASSDETPPVKTVRLTEGTLLASGYTVSETNALLEKVRNGEPLHPFHSASYEIYNRPASENGLEGDLLLLSGTVTEIFHSGSKSEYVVCLRLLQDDGHEWVITCGQYQNKKMTVGRRLGSSLDSHVFEECEGKVVEVYGKYMGYSNKYSLPGIDVMTYGGILLTEERLFISTMTSAQEMQRDRILNLSYLLGVDRHLESVDKK